MTLIRNVSPRGALDVPLLRAVVEAGQEVDVTSEHAAILLAQVDNWHPADAQADDLLAAILSASEQSPPAGGVLKGAALAAALDAAGLPATGTAEQKRAALAAFAQLDADTTSDTTDEREKR